MLVDYQLGNLHHCQAINNKVCFYNNINSWLDILRKSDGR